MIKSTGLYYIDINKNEIIDKIECDNNFDNILCLEKSNDFIFTEFNSNSIYYIEYNCNSGKILNKLKLKENCRDRVIEKMEIKNDDYLIVKYRDNYGDSPHWMEIFMINEIKRSKKLINPLGRINKNVSTFSITSNNKYLIIGIYMVKKIIVYKLNTENLIQFEDLELNEWIHEIESSGNYIFVKLLPSCQIKLFEIREFN